MPGARAKVYIYESEYKAIVAATREFPNIETGGDLFGTFTHADMPVIWLASGPGPNVQRNAVHFEQDAAFTTDWERRLKQGFGLQYIGTWHSHHHLGLRTPSEGDRNSARTYARNHSRQRTLEIIVTFEGRQTALLPYFYPNAQDGRWVEAEFAFLDGISPMRSQLGEDEAFFSGGADWRHVQLEREVRRQRNADLESYSSASHTQGQHSPAEEDEGVEIPPDLESEIAGISSHIDDISQVGDIFAVRAITEKGRYVDILINSRRMLIEQIDLIDPRKGTAKNITENLRQKLFSLRLLRQGDKTLKKLLREIDYLDRVGEDEGKSDHHEGEGGIKPEDPIAAAESQREQPGPAESQGEQQELAARSSPSPEEEEAQGREEETPARQSQTEEAQPAGVSQAIGVQIIRLSNRAGRETFRVIITLSDKEAYAMLKRRFPFPVESWGEKEPFTATTTSQSRENLEAIMKRLKHIFPDAPYKIETLEQQRDQQEATMSERPDEESPFESVAKWFDSIWQKFLRQGF